MKKLIVTLAAATLAVPAMAQSGGIVLAEYGSYTNRGQCESALAQVRNDQRRNPETRGAGYEDLTGSEFNRASRTTTRCERVNNEWVFVYYEDGFAS